MEYATNIYVCNVMGDILYPLDDIDKSSVVLNERLNGQWELSFTYTQRKGEISPAFDALEEGMYLFLEDKGHFKMRQPSLRIDSVTESKTINAFSCDVEFEDKTITFPINMGTETSLEFQLNDGKQELPYTWLSVDENKVVYGYYNAHANTFYTDSSQTVELAKDDQLFYVHTTYYHGELVETAYQWNGTSFVSTTIKHDAFELLRDPYTMHPYDWIVLYNTYTQQLKEFLKWYQEWSIDQQVSQDYMITLARGSYGYYDEANDKFYRDMEMTDEIDAVLGLYYIDMTSSNGSALHHAYMYGIDPDGDNLLTFLRTPDNDHYDVVSDDEFNKRLALLDLIPRLVSSAKHIEGVSDVVTVDDVMDTSTVDYRYTQYAFKHEDENKNIVAISFSVNTIDANADFETRIRMLIGYYKKYSKQLSLLDIMCAQTNYAWAVGDVYGLNNNPIDYSLANTRMQFDIDETIYSFLASTYAQWSKCLVTFDILNRKINITPVEYVGRDTGVVLTYDQLLTTLKIESNEDTLATRLTIKGGDDLSIEQVNFGQDQVVDLAYKLNARDRNGNRIYVSDTLAEKYARYEKVRERLRTGKVGLEQYFKTLDPISSEYSEVQEELEQWDEDTEGYYDLSKIRNQLNAELYELKYRVPADSVHEDWDTYNDKEIEEALKTYSNKLHALYELYAEDYGREWKNSDLPTPDPWVNLSTDTTYPVPDWILLEDDETMMPRLSFIQATMYWWDFVAYHQTLTQIKIAMQARFESDPSYKFSGITATSDNADIREQYKKITAFETEWSLYGSIELERKIGSYDTQMQTLIDGDAVQVKHCEWENLANIAYEEVRFGYYDTSQNRFFTSVLKDQEIDPVLHRFYVDITQIGGQPKKDIYQFNGTTFIQVVATPTLQNTPHGLGWLERNIDIQTARLSVLQSQIDALDPISPDYDRLRDEFELQIVEQTKLIELLEKDSVRQQQDFITQDTSIDLTKKYYSSLQFAFTDSTGGLYDQACDVLKKKHTWGELRTENPNEKSFFVNDVAYNALLDANIISKEHLQWNQLTDSQKQRYGNTEANYAYDTYKEIYDYRMEAQEYLDTYVTPVIESKESELQSVQNRRTEISNIARLDTYKHPESGESFSAYELKVLSLLMRDAEYTNEYIFTTTLHDTVEAVDKMEELYQDAIEQVRTFSRPQLTFTAEADNLLSLPQFDAWHDRDNNQFQLGNYLYVEYRDGTFIRVRMVGRKYNPCLMGGSDFEIEFSNITYTKTKVSDVENVLGLATSTTSAGGGSSGGGGSGSTETWDEIYAVLSSAMIKRLLSPESFIREVSNVVANRVIRKALTTKEQIYNSLASGLADINGECLCGSWIRSEAEHDDGQGNSYPVSWLNLDDGTFSFANGALMFVKDGSIGSQQYGNLVVTGEVNADAGQIGGVQLGWIDIEHYQQNKINRLCLNQSGISYLNATPYAVANPAGENPSAQHWLELVDGQYELTTDTSPRNYATYYKQQLNKQFRVGEISGTWQIEMRESAYIPGTDEKSYDIYTYYSPWGFYGRYQIMSATPNSVEISFQHGSVTATGQIKGNALTADTVTAQTSVSSAQVVVGSNGVSNDGAYVGTGNLRVYGASKWIAVTPNNNTTVSNSTTYNGVSMHSSGQIRASDRITGASVYAGTVNCAQHSDFAELFEWQDGNPQNEDRRGRFVTLIGDKICLAQSNDEYLVGIISGTPAVINNTAADAWHNKYLHDEFGAIITEPIVHDAIVDSNNVVIEDAYIEYKPVINPNYDETRLYVPREQRQEWAPVGMVGQIIMLDDGTCEVNGFAKSADEGIATKADTVTNYRVMKRIDDHHIMVAAK